MPLYPYLYEYLPIPVLGAVVGSIAGTMLANSLGAKNKVTARMIRGEIDEYIAQLDEKHEMLIAEITEEFSKLGELTTAAFNIDNNYKLLEASIDLAKAYGVDESRILKSKQEVDTFMQT